MNSNLAFALTLPIFADPDEARKLKSDYIQGILNEYPWLKVNGIDEPIDEYKTPMGVDDLLRAIAEKNSSKGNQNNKDNNQNQKQEKQNNNQNQEKQNNNQNNNNEKKENNSGKKNNDPAPIEIVVPKASAGDMLTFGLSPTHHVSACNSRGGCYPCVDKYSLVYDCERSKNRLKIYAEDVLADMYKNDIARHRYGCSYGYSNPFTAATIAAFEREPIREYDCFYKHGYNIMGKRNQLIDIISANPKCKFRLEVE